MLEILPIKDDKVLSEGSNGEWDENPKLFALCSSSGLTKTMKATIAVRNAVTAFN